MNTSSDGTHNPLVAGSNPAGPTNHAASADSAHSHRRIKQPLSNIQRSGLTRRRFLSGLTALAVAHRAAANGWAILDDYVNGNVYDIGAALQVGPVQLLNREYDCLPVRLRDQDVIEGINSQSILNFEADEPAFAPLDESRQTILCTLRDFDVMCARRGGASQHAFWMPSCSRWRLVNLAIIGFGGIGVCIYGQRTLAGGKDPSDATFNRLTDCRIGTCLHGIVLTGTRGEPRIKGGTANCNHVETTTVSSCRGHGVWINQGGLNELDHVIGGNHGGDMFRIAWYSNTLVAPGAERTGGWGIFFTGNAETRANRVLGYHDGGANGKRGIGGKLKGQVIL